MFLRLGVGVMALAAVIATVAGNRASLETAPEPLPGSAIELLGEAWTITAPEPVDQDLRLQSPPSSPGPALVRPPMRSGEGPLSARAAEATASLRRPLPRPDAAAAAGASRLGPSDSASGGNPGPGGASGAAAERRWIVRSRGSGDVIAELPLPEALALLQARQRRP
jgi:hypothetical protein